MKTRCGLISVLIALSVLTFGAEPESGSRKSGFFDFLRKRSKSIPAETGSLADLTSSQITSGLKEAVEKGLRSAVQHLGKPDGFLTNANVRIPVPEKLKTIETTLRKLNQDALVDEFETTMNRAAEKAVPAGTEVLMKSLTDMTVEDAKGLVKSESPTAITEYFRRTSGDELARKFLPIVQEATAEAGVTSAYKDLLSKASFGNFSFLPRASVDVDQYVTDKTLDGLFVMIGDEEKRIRANPQARTTDLLRKVFGSLNQ